MDGIDLLRQQFRESNDLLGATMQGVTGDQAHWKPGGTANPLGATYAHIVLVQDLVANVLVKRGAALATTTWTGKLGVSEPPPSDDPTGWSQWARLVKVDLDALRDYSQAVQTSVDQVLVSLSDADLNRKVETPFGTSTVLFLINNALIGHTHGHTGEISCLKGLQGAKGYPV